MNINTVTFDTCCTTNYANFPTYQKAVKKGYELALVATSHQEVLGTSMEINFSDSDDGFETSCTYGYQSHEHSEYLKMLVLPEVRTSQFEPIVRVISNGSIKNPRFATNLAWGEKQIIKDAKIICSHVAAKRYLFVSDDDKAFIKNGRREKLELLTGSRILRAIEFENLINGMLPKYLLSEGKGLFQM